MLCQELIKNFFLIAIAIPSYNSTKTIVSIVLFKVLHLSTLIYVGYIACHPLKAAPGPFMMSWLSAGNYYVAFCTVIILWTKPSYHNDHISQGHWLWYKTKFLWIFQNSKYYHGHLKILLLAVSQAEHWEDH